MKYDQQAQEALSRILLPVAPMTDESYRIVLRDAYAVSAATEGRDASVVLREAAAFTMKNLLSAHSIWILVNPTLSHSPLKVKLLDFASARVIIRSMMECYVNMYYLLIDPNSKGEQHYRLLRWRLHAHMERVVLGRKTKSKNPKYDEEYEEALKIRRAIVSSAYFKQLPRAKRKAFKEATKTIGKGFNWADEDDTFEKRAIKTEVRWSWFDAEYKYLSNYTHSLSLSLLHLLSVNSFSDTVRMSRNSFQMAEAMLCLTIELFIRLYPEYVNRLSYEGARVVELWRGAMAEEISLTPE